MTEIRVPREITERIVEEALEDLRAEAIESEIAARVYETDLAIEAMTAEIDRRVYTVPADYSRARWMTWRRVTQPAV